MRKKIIQFILKIICIKIIKKYQPEIIAITGSVGKTSTKNAIFDVFSDEFNIRKSSGNLNSEVGAPLVFIGITKPPENIKDWLLVFFKGFLLIIKKQKDYPKIIISELAADKPGDISYLVNFIRPSIGIITAVGEVPVHIEFYKDSKQLAKEKTNIFRYFNHNSTAIINKDDYHYKTIKENINKEAKTTSFGFDKNADIRIINFSIVSSSSSLVTLEYNKKTFNINLHNCLDDSFAFIAASVFAVGIALSVDPNKLVKKISKIKPSPGRLNPIPGINNSLILDGSYNAAPLSMKSALNALEKIKGNKKIAVMGDMLELGDYKDNEHQKILEIAISFCDYIFVIGENYQRVKEQLLQSKTDKNNIFCFDVAENAIPVLQKIIESGDIILVKGSQKTKTEKIVYAIIKNNEKEKV